MKKIILSLIAIICLGTTTNADIGLGAGTIRVQGDPLGNGHFLHCADFGTCFTGYRESANDPWHIQIWGYEGDYTMGVNAGENLDNEGEVNEDGELECTMNSPILVNE